MAGHRIKVHPNAADAAEQITWDFHFKVAFFDEFHDRFEKYGLLPYDWDSVLDDRYSVFVIMIGGFFSPRITVVTDTHTDECFMLGLVRGDSEKQMRDDACSLVCSVLGLNNPYREDNPEV